MNSDTIMTIRRWISIPFIWGISIPVVFLHLLWEVYHQVAFRLYGIPRVRARDYIIIDRAELSYLTIFGKLSCVYCWYVNGALAYFVEIAARTERHFCPIKHLKKMKAPHSQYDKFLERTDGATFYQHMDELRDYSDLK